MDGSVPAPLCSGGRLQAQATFACRRMALVAFGELEDALAGVGRLAEQSASLERQRDLLTDTLRLATSQYRAGYATYLEQLDAQRGLLGAELAVLQTRADLLNAAVGLYQAMGGGVVARTGKSR